MQRSPGGPVQTLLNGTLVLGLAIGLSVAWYLSYRGNLAAHGAFAYELAVAAAQRDAAALRDASDDPADDASRAPAAQTLLVDDLRRMSALAREPAQRAPVFAFPAQTADLDRLLRDLDDRAHLASVRFDGIAKGNLASRDLTFGIFALIGAILVLVRARLHRRVQEGRALVDRLQRAFMSRHRVLPNIDVGTVLLSATRGSNIGGDMYDVFCGTGGYGYLLIADVSGKGIDAAVDTAFIKYTVRALFNQVPDPGRILTLFSGMYAQTIANPESFVVLFLAVVDVETCAITYASAGHEPAFLCHGSDVRPLEATGPIIGIDPDAVYETQPMPLADDGYLVLSTDGLTETRDRKGVLLGAEGLAQWLSHVEGSAQQVADRLVRRLRKRSRNRILDDLAVLVVRVVRSVPSPPPSAPSKTAAREYARLP
jgi:serine phosphatase RsbU (regulator of sigma subunit)